MTKLRQLQVSWFLLWKALEASGKKEQRRRLLEAFTIQLVKGGFLWVALVRALSARLLHCPAWFWDLGPPSPAASVPMQPVRL